MRFNRGNLFSFLNIHFLLVALLAVTNIVLLTRLVLAWHTLHADRPEQIAEYQTNLKTLQLQTAPLRGLPQKVETSNTQALQFYDRRMPSNYSSIAAELNTLAQKANIRVSRYGLTQLPAIPNLAEIRIDASLSGEYAPIMRFINSIERDRMFFVIRGLALTGQQGGVVNVRMNLTTYLHATDIDRTTPPPSGGEPDNGPSTPSASLASNNLQTGGQ